MALSNSPLKAGVDASYWRERVQALPEWELPLPKRVLVLAPHPDDEVLACSGFLQRCSQANVPIEFWMITDGEACFGASVPAVQVMRWRRKETRLAHQRLNLTDANCRMHWLGFPDGEVHKHIADLEQLLLQAVTPETTVLAPLRNDFHPDHEATATAALLATRAAGLTLISYPVWLWYRGHAGDLLKSSGDAVRFNLTASEQWRKQDAIAAFTSQINPVTNSQAILPRGVLRHFYTGCEVFLLQPSELHENTP